MKFFVFVVPQRDFDDLALGELLEGSGEFLGEGWILYWRACRLLSVGVLTRKSLVPQHSCAATLGTVWWSVG